MYGTCYSLMTLIENTKNGHSLPIWCQFSQMTKTGVRDIQMKQGPLNGLFYVLRQAMLLNGLRIGELLKDGEFSPHLKTLWVWLYPIEHYIELDEPGYFSVNNRIPVTDQYRFGCYTRFI